MAAFIDENIIKLDRYLYLYESFEIVSLETERRLVGKELKFDEDLYDELLLEGEKTKNYNTVLLFAQIIKVKNDFTWYDFEKNIDFESLKVFISEFGLPVVDRSYENNETQTYCDYDELLEHAVIFAILTKIYNSINNLDWRSVIQFSNKLLDHPVGIDRPVMPELIFDLHPIDEINTTSIDEYYTDDERIDQFTLETLSYKHLTSIELTHYFMVWIDQILNSQINQMRIEVNSRFPHINFYTKSLYKYMYFEISKMFSEITFKESNQNMVQCQNGKCQRFFIGHGNRKYCYFCNRKTIWSRKNKKHGGD